MTLPTPPLRSDGPATFADRGDAFLAALPPFEVRMEAIDTNVTAKEASATISAAAAAASQLAAATVSGSTIWVSGTTYAIGDVRWSPSNGQSYRRKTAGAGTTDPASDASNWAQIAGVPVQTGNSGKVLGTDGTNASWTQRLPSQTGNAGKVLFTDGSAESWSMPVPAATYANAANLRSMTPVDGATTIVDGLGLFVWRSGSTAVDDGETAFATGSGVWELVGASPDYIYSAVYTDVLDVEGRATALEARAKALESVNTRILRGSFSMSLTSLATIVSSNFTATIVGAAVGDSVVINPGDSFGTAESDQGKLSYIAYVSAADTVTISIRNASASTANMTASTWVVLVLKA